MRLRRQLLACTYFKLCKDTFCCALHGEGASRCDAILLPAQALLPIVTIGAAIAAALGLAAATACLVRAFLRPKQAGAVQTTLDSRGDARSLHYCVVHVAAVCDTVAVLFFGSVALTKYCAVPINLIVHDPCKVTFVV